MIALAHSVSVPWDAPCSLPGKTDGRLALALPLVPSSSRIARRPVAKLFGRDAILCACVSSREVAFR